MQILSNKASLKIGIEEKWENSLRKLRSTLYYSPLQLFAWYKFIQLTFPESFVIYDDEYDFYYIVQVLKTRLGYYGWIRHAPVNVRQFNKAPIEYISSRINLIHKACTVKSSSKYSMLCKRISWINVQFRALCPREYRHILCRTPRFTDVVTSIFTAKNIFYSMAHEYDFERTIIVDLTTNLDVSSTTKRYYKKGLKKGLKLIESSDPNPLYNLLLQTARRKGYSEWGKSYLINKYKTLSARNNARIFYVKYKNRVIYGAIYIGDKNYIVYDHGGGDSNFLYLNPAYFLHFSVMQKLKEQGYKFFDLGGIGSESPKHPLFKNSRIKYRFGGQVYQYIHTWDTPIKRLSWIKYYIYTYARNKRLGWYN